MVKAYYFNQKWRKFSDAGEERAMLATGEINFYDQHLQNPRNAVLTKIISTCGNLNIISTHSYRQFAPGEPECHKISVALRKHPFNRSRLGQLISFWFNLGPAPVLNERIFIHLGFN